MLHMAGDAFVCLACEGTVLPPVNRQDCESSVSQSDCTDVAQMCQGSDELKFTLRGGGFGTNL